MSRMWPTMLAACAVVAVGAVALDRVIDSRAATNRAVMAAPADREFATRRSQRADIYLSDGTRVVLNVDTRLRVPATFGAAAREVWLEGEAYFKVAADSMRPFRVRTAAGIAEDVSTAFIVRHYPESDAMQVGVAEGVVLVRRDSASPLTAMLERGDLARLDGAGRVSVQHGVNMEQEMAWTSGTLVFDRVPLREVVPRLARWFDADIRLHDDALGDVRYTASFRSERVEKVLELLAASLDARVDRHAENAFVISARRPGR